MPTVGLTACRKIEDYRQAVLHVGGEVRVLQPGADVADVAEVLAAIDGVLLSGGEDLAPARYGERPHPSVVDVNLERDAFEIALIEGARTKRLPIFAICRGIQVLNVACGGSLYQDIAAQVPAAIKHDFTARQGHLDRAGSPHDVTVKAGTRLAAILGTHVVPVNSIHHQAVKELGSGLIASAFAPDGVVEALERSSHPFALAVQWHPEDLVDAQPVMGRLFEAFVEASRGS